MGTAEQVVVNGTSITYTDVGSGVPVFLMHGNPDSRVSWQPIIDALGSGVRVIAPDFPGFGDSEPLPKSAGVMAEDMVRLWDAFLAAIGVDEPIVAAVHDLGGPWFLPWVAANPDRTRGVLIMNTLFQKRYQWHPVARIWQKPFFGELSMLLMSRKAFRQEFQTKSKLPLSEIDARFDAMTPTTKRTVLRVYRAYADTKTALGDWEERLLDALKQTEARVIWGDTDPYIPPDFADAYGVEATHIPDAGHWHHLENPKPCADALLELSRA